MPLFTFSLTPLFVALGMNTEAGKAWFMSCVLCYRIPIVNTLRSIQPCPVFRNN